MNRVSVTKIMMTETGHRLIDYPQGRCQHWHGHSYRWEITASADQLNSIGMVVDFSDLKQAMKEVIDPLDHAFLLSEQDPFVVAHGEKGVEEILKSSAGNIPRLFILPFNPTAENLVQWVGSQLESLLPEDVQLTQVRVWETATSYADWVLS